MPERLLARHGAAALQAHQLAVTNLTVDTDPPLGDYTLNYLVSARLARNVPFQYLVPDPALLPLESARFFTIDEAWSDALTEGILAVGAASTRDTEHVAAVLPTLQDAVRRATPLAAQVRRRTISRAELAAHVNLAARAAVTGDAPQLPDPPPVTGMLLRSALVSDYPGLSLRAFTTTAIESGVDPSSVPADEVVPILRMDLLAPTVLLVLFASTPQLVWIEEPHHGIQLGVEEGDVIIPVAANGEPLNPAPPAVPVPMRAGPVPGVIDVAALGDALGVSGSSALATQLLRPPYRIRFSADQPNPSP
jgi:hypothetical protein